MALTLKLDESGFPFLSSGHMVLRNPASKREVRINFTDRASGKHVPVIVDTGAGSTLLPGSIAAELGVKEPAPERRHWPIMRGVGGISYGFIPDVPIQIRLGCKGQTPYSESIFPYFYQGSAPAFHACAKLLEGQAVFPKWICEYITVPIQWSADGFSAKVHAPVGDCEVLGCRAKLNVNADHGDINYILLGRDWQNALNLAFGETTLTITRPRNLSA